ncbi:MAG TPA: DUF2892 domain-containing protein [Chitinophagales bacterium]|nr:DUF2892 domain-containing protein [Chitinophagales bacterium]
MKRNVGGVDKWIRIGAGAALVGLYVGNVLPRNKWGKASLLAGGNLLATGLAGYCPISQVAGVNTRRSNSVVDQMRRMHTL